MAYGSVEDLHFDNLSVSGNDEYRSPTTCCTSCKEDGQEVEAVRYCIDCEEYQCRKCGRSHDRYNNGHDVVGESKRWRWGEEKATKLPTEKCQMHIGEVLQIYCLNHDELCCHVCVAMEHSTCKEKKYIPDLAENISDDNEHKALDAGMKDIVTHLNAILEQSAINKDNIDNSLNRFDQHIEETKAKLLVAFNRSAEEARTNVTWKRQQIYWEIDSTITLAGELVSEVQQLQSKIDPRKVTNKSQLFINLKNVRGELKQTLDRLNEIPRQQPRDISIDFCREITALLNRNVDILKHKMDSVSAPAFNNDHILPLIQKRPKVEENTRTGYGGIKI